MKDSKHNFSSSRYRDQPVPVKKRKLNDEQWRATQSIPRTSLPIHSRRSDIMSTLAVSQVLIVQGDTGCGKTTQIPQFILQEFPTSRVVVTQPRRLAAIGVAKRVSEEMGCSLGDVVGYHIKGEKLYGDSSRVVFMTTGMFIQELVGSSEFPWTHVIVDEVHERAVETEFLLVILKHILARKDSKLILMSATIDTNLFANYYADSEIRAVGTSLPWFEISENVKFDTSLNSFEEVKEQDIFRTAEEEFLDSFREDEQKQNTLQFQPKIARVQNPYEIDREDAAPIKLAGPRNYQVMEIYLEEIQNWLVNGPEIDWEEVFGLFALEIASINDKLYQIAAHLIRYQHIHLVFEEETPQTFLIFLPGIHEIHRMQDTILEQMADLSENLEICLLHSSIPEELHGRIFKSPMGKRRIILSTNIAESSITLPDVRYIIDFCNVKELLHNARTNTEMLELQWASKATMKQRAGRAGRVAEGVAFRLIPREFYQVLPDYSMPEIQRCPLDKLILKIKQLNLGTPKEILGRALQPPDLQDIECAEKFLIEMGALNKEEQLTWLGKVYADMPCDIKISRLCLFGYIFGCMHESLVMAAALAQEKSPFLSMANLPFRYAREESRAYAQRLVWDWNRDSDPIAYLAAYSTWFDIFGKNIKKTMKHSKKFISKVPASNEEKSWARKHYIDHNVMREIMLTYEEIKRRFLMMNLAPTHLKNRNNPTDPDTVLRMKLCLAAAFIGKYCQSHFAYEDEIKRRKKESYLKERAKNTILIPKIPDFVNEKDIRYILQECRTDEISIDLNDGTAYISFGNKYQNKRKIYCSFSNGTLAWYL
jgi:ATP-dependent RNA helicase DHX57